VRSEFIEVTLFAIIGLEKMDPATLMNDLNFGFTENYTGYLMRVE
jgi:hypothetical protein